MMMVSIIINHHGYYQNNYHGCYHNNYHGYYQNNGIGYDDGYYLGLLSR